MPQRLLAGLILTATAAAPAIPGAAARRDISLELSTVFSDHGFIRSDCSEADMKLVRNMRQHSELMCGSMEIDDAYALARTISRELSVGGYRTIEMRHFDDEQGQRVHIRALELDEGIALFVDIFFDGRTKIMWKVAE